MTKQMMWMLSAVVGATMLVTPVWADDVDVLEKTYAAKIDELIPDMGHADLLQRQKPQQELERMCFEVCLPGNEVKREALSRAIMAKVGPETPLEARAWMLRKIERMGRDEVVDTLEDLLEDDNERIRELARRALMNNPAEDAGEALRDALEDADDAKTQIAMIDAVAFRHDGDAVDDVIDLAESDNKDVALAAVIALGRIATEDAVEAVIEMRPTAEGMMKERLTESCLRGAEAFMADGKNGLAAAIYEMLVGENEPETVRIAALQGLTAAKGAAAMPVLVELMVGDCPRMALVAAQCARDVPGAGATRQLATVMGAAPADLKVQILKVLAARGDVTARDAVVAELGNDDEKVQVAAAKALATVGDESVVMTLAKCAAKGTPDRRDAARESLANMKGEAIDDAILLSLNKARPDAKAELIGAVRARNLTQALPTLLGLAHDDSVQVRLAALKALQTMASVKDLTNLTLILAGASDAQERRAAEECIRSVLSRANGNVRRAQAGSFVKAINAAGKPEFEASLVRILGTIGGPEALAAVQARTKSTDQAVKDAAIRELSDWPGPGALDSLLEVAKSAEGVHRELALGGYVRLARQAGQKGPAVTLQRLQQAMALASTTAERKVVLQAMRDTAHLDAMSMIMPLVDDKDLGAEAAKSIIGIAVGVSGQHRAEAVRALEQVRQNAPSDDLKEQAEDALGQIMRYCVSWVCSGPYRQKGKKGNQLLDVAFAPEDDSKVAEWRPLPVVNIDFPGEFQLGDQFKQNNFCLYVRTNIWSDAEREAELLLGSDDGVKAWLNGEVVLTKAVERGVVCDEDIVGIKLNKGWNTLQLKVGQNGGGFGFCSRVRGTDGKSIKTLRYEAKP